MRENFDKYILLSDLDGTLFNVDTKVPERNKRAIQLFIERGGKFGVSTGRTPGNALPLLKDIQINMPSIFLNGALLYDVNTREDLCIHTLEHNAALKIITRCLEKYPCIDVQVYDNRNILIVSPEETACQHWVESHQPCYFVSLGDVQDRGWTKLLLLGENGVLKKIEKEVREMGLLEKVETVFSSESYLEILPKGINKGQMLEFLKENYYQDKLTCAIGDFYNDIELLKTADISATPKSGIEELKKIATYIVCKHSEGSVADFIECL